MHDYRRFSPLLATALALLGPTVAHSQTAQTACRPLIDAEKKQIVAAKHVYMTERSTIPGAKDEAHESITAGGVNYMMMHGKWMRSPLSPKDFLEQLEQNLTTAKVYTCRRLGNESVGGASSIVYTAHTENEGVTADVRTWVASGTGLPLRQEEDLDTGAGDKRHLSIRYEYGNVRAPEVGK